MTGFTSASREARHVGRWAGDQKFPQIGDNWLATSPAEYLDYRDRTRVFTSIAGYEDVAFDLTGGREPVRIPAQRVTHTLFETQAACGRCSSRSPEPSS